ncbi:hypothetical protein EX30DRAFT_367155 [Ascodesmis nigricans]|uniref:Uncharacterized protein n=1 Tax=Ascodesmis nigricans TaxID=341454 RepID=A0A4S2MIN3_9PEZI|nr:hypothetical protein EX30DRAFT_367155 [Ascodesmis nigricans]
MATVPDARRVDDRSFNTRSSNASSPICTLQSPQYRILTTATSTSASTSPTPVHSYLRLYNLYTRFPPASAVVSLNHTPNRSFSAGIQCYPTSASPMAATPPAATIPTASTRTSAIPTWTTAIQRPLLFQPPRVVCAERSYSTGTTLRNMRNTPPGSPPPHSPPHNSPPGETTCDCAITADVATWLLRHLRMVTMFVCNNESVMNRGYDDEVSSHQFSTLSSMSANHGGVEIGVSTPALTLNRRVDPAMFPARPPPSHAPQVRITSIYGETVHTALPRSLPLPVRSESFRLRDAPQHSPVTIGSRVGSVSGGLSGKAYSRIFVLSSAGVDEN